MSLIYDTHTDLSMNAMEWNRDLRWALKVLYSFALIIYIDIRIPCTPCHYKQYYPSHKRG